MSILISLLASAVLSTALAPVRLSPFVRAETRVPVPMPTECPFWEPKHRKHRPKRKNR
jgi:hypothetical protein